MRRFQAIRSVKKQTGRLTTTDKEFSKKILQLHGSETMPEKGRRCPVFGSVLLSAGGNFPAELKKFFSAALTVRHSFLL